MEKPETKGSLSLRERGRVRGAKTLRSHARLLRRQATDAEQQLWRYLRGRGMAGYKFRRQVVIEPYIADFVCLEARLILEADGGQHVEQRRYDLKRSAHFEAMGYRVMRFWNDEILQQPRNVLEQIHRALTEPRSPQSGP